MGREVKGEARPDAKWKALLESCRRKIDTQVAHIRPSCTSFLFRFHPGPRSCSFARSLSFCLSSVPLFRLPTTTFHESPVNHPSRYGSLELLPFLLSSSFFFSPLNVDSGSANLRREIHVGTTGRASEELNSRNLLLASLQFHYLYISPANIE